MNGIMPQLDAIEDDLEPYDRDAVVRALQRYLDGLSLYYAAREERIPEERLRRWIAALGLKRSPQQLADIRRSRDRVSSAVAVTSPK